MAKNFGDKLVGSIGWLLIGILVFLGSFYVLYKTEGRADYSKIAEKAIEVTDSKSEDDFIYVTDKLNTPETLGDDLYLDEGDYLVVDRTVEMFAWIEEKHIEDDEEYFTYDTAWVEDVPDSSDFDEQRRHENPSKPEKSKRFTVSVAKIGEYEFDIDKVQLPGLSSLELKDEDVMIYGYEELVSDDNYDYIFDGYGSFDDPEIGDIRIRYSVLQSGAKATIFGQIDDNELAAASGEKERGLYRIFWGTNDDAMATLKGEYKTIGWVGRIGSFLLMWIGLMLILKPVTVSMELIPFLSGLGKSALGVITFVVALILTIVASIIFSIIQNVFALVIIAAAVIGIGVYINFMKPSTTKKPHHEREVKH